MLSTGEIVRLRPEKNAVNPQRPQAFFVEVEPAGDGAVQQVATILLVGRECIFHCLMCDLWKNTLDAPTPSGAIPAQIDDALAHLPPAHVLKLYNSSNFFDPLAVPVGDYAAVASRGRRFARVIVENHPRLVNQRCSEFSELLRPTELEVALGLETVHAPSLAALNKQMSVSDFAEATRFLLQRGIAVRAFVLLRLPGMSEQEGVEWALRSLEMAFALGVQTCSVIPLRGGNGALELLAKRGQFAAPTIRSLEMVLDESLGWRRGRVFADLWDIRRLSSCDDCFQPRVERIQKMNLTQRVLPAVSCARCNG